MSLARTSTGKHFEVLKLAIMGVGHDEHGPFVLLKETLKSADGKAGTLQGAQKYRPGQTLVWRAETTTYTNLKRVELEDDDGE